MRQTILKLARRAFFSCFHWTNPISLFVLQHPVYCLGMVGTQNAHNVISISSDGKLCSWSLDMLSVPQEILELQYKYVRICEKKNVFRSLCVNWNVSLFLYPSSTDNQNQLQLQVWHSQRMKSIISCWAAKMAMYIQVNQDEDKLIHCQLSSMF